jgi:hypothetical protein
VVCRTQRLRKELADHKGSPLFLFYVVGDVVLGVGDVFRRAEGLSGGYGDC